LIDKPKGSSALELLSQFRERSLTWIVGSKPSLSVKKRRQFLRAVPLFVATSNVANALSASGIQPTLFVSEGYFELKFGRQSWICDVAWFAEGANLVVEKSVNETTFALTNARALGTSALFDFKAILDSNTGVFQIAFSALELLGEVDVGNWLSGSKPLTLGHGSFEVPTAIGKLHFDTTGTGCTFSPDWSFDDLQVASRESRHSSVFPRNSQPARLFLGDQRAGKIRSRNLVIVTIGDQSVQEKQTVLAFSKIVSLREISSLAALKFEAMEVGQSWSGQCNAVADACLLQIGDEGTTKTSSLSMMLAQSAMRLGISSEGLVTRYEMEAVLSADGSSVFSDGIQTRLLMDDALPGFNLKGNANEINELGFQALAAGDYVPCSGAQCATASIDRQSVEFKLASAATIDSRSLIYAVDSRTGKISRPSVSWKVRFLRREDKLDITAEFYNLRPKYGLSGFLSPRLEAIDQTKDAYVLIEFPPQHISEKSRVVDTTSGTGAHLTLSILEPESSRHSRVFFRIPKDILPLRYALDDILAFDQFDVVVDPSALSSSDPTNQGAFIRETTVINIHKASLVPVTFASSDVDTPPDLRALVPLKRPQKGKNNEDFHLRLIDRQLRGSSGISSGVGLAFGYVDDWKVDPQADPLIIRPLSQRDRVDLRTLTFLRNVIVIGKRAPVLRNPEPIVGSTVLLTSRGGYLQLEGSWEPQLQISLVRYLHTIAQGRDVEVTVVRQYLLYPFGHRVLLVKQTKRKNGDVIRGVDGQITYAGALETTFFLLVQDDTIAYSPDAMPMPFRSVSIPREYWRSPSLDYNAGVSATSCDDYQPFKPVAKHTLNAGDWGNQAFWPTVGHIPWQYGFTGIDSAGKAQDFKRAVILIEFRADNTVSPPSAQSKTFQQTSEQTSAEIQCMLLNRFNDSRYSFNTFPTVPDMPPEQQGVAVFAQINPVNSQSSVGRAIVSFAESFVIGDTQLEVSRMSFTAKLKAAENCSPSKKEDPAPDEHVCPWIPTVHWVDGRFRASSLDNASYVNENDLRFLLVDPETGLLFDPEQPQCVLEITQNGNVNSYAKIILSGPIKIPKEVVKQSEALAGIAAFAIIDRLARQGSSERGIGTSYRSNTTQSGAIVSPDVLIGAASRRFGATALPSNATAGLALTGVALTTAEVGSMAADQVFPSDAKVIGVELIKIIAPLLGGGAAPPAFLSLLNQIADGQDYYSKSLDWTITKKKNELLPFPRDGGDYAFFSPGEDGMLRLAATGTVWVTAFKPPEINLSATLSDCTVNIGWGSGSSFNGVSIPFQNISVSSKNGQKPVVDVTLGEVKFVGPALQFIGQLQKTLKELTSTSSGWRIGFEDGAILVDAPPFQIPDLQLGAFSTENFAIYSGLKLPLTDGGGLVFIFSLSKPDSRFRICAFPYAGGGYAQLELESTDVVKFELCLEFGAAKSLRYGPVSGDVGILGGVIYQHKWLPVVLSGGLTSKQTEVTIVAFVRAFGTFSAWSLISVFMELYVEMRSASNDEVSGTARFTLSVSMMFVSYSYTASHREVLRKAGSRSRRVSLRSSSGSPAAAEGQIHTERNTIDLNQLKVFMDSFAD
jgi:hypothetical protein